MWGPNGLLYVFPQNGLQFSETAPVGKKVENDVHQINLYPLDIGFPDTYPQDRDSSNQ